MKTAVYFKPPLEERNPELLIVQQQIKPKLKEVLSEKHQPLHKVLRPQSAATFSQTSSAYYPSHSKIDFSVLTSKQKDKYNRRVHEKNRKQRIINDRICAINRFQTYSERQQVKEEDGRTNNMNGEDLRVGLSPQKAKEIVDKALQMQIQREQVVNPEKHKLIMRGGTHNWRSHLRSYNDKQKVMIKSTSPIKMTVAQDIYVQQQEPKPQYREQQIQTIKSVFKPQMKDESLSAISFTTTH